MIVMRRRYSALAPVAAIVASGCLFGPTATSFLPATEPRGVWAYLEVMAPHESIAGELLAVDDTALLVLQEQGLQAATTRVGMPQLVLVPTRDISAGYFEQLGASIRRRRFESEAAAARVRLASRYPQGVKPALLAALLSAYGQTRLNVRD